ncbi:MAG: DUF4349 domain-containing protein [Prochlorothrix sp.]|nr:DUF4349 domain-containing protein [Prochlorothrix sp.]
MIPVPPLPPLRRSARSRSGSPRSGSPRSTQPQRFPPQHLPLQRLLWAGLLGLTATTACASVGDQSSPSLEAASAPEASALQPLAEPELAEDMHLSQAPSSGEALSGAAAPDALPRSEAAASSAPRSAPQLIKTAHLDLQVENTAAALDQLVQQVRQNQGDILSLEDQVPLSDQVPHSAYIQVRVPQERLDRALEQFSSLGQVTNQQISAQDVSEQLVDFGARLRNLEKAEELTLGIMERSGDVSDVLQVTQELARIREQIEQINAQLQRLRTQVAYSTVYISLTEPVSTIQPLERSWGRDISLAWQRSTRSLSAFTRGMVVLAIWLAVYSPYWLTFGAGTFFLAKFLRYQFKKPQS